MSKHNESSLAYHLDMAKKNLESIPDWVKSDGYEFNSQEQSNNQQDTSIEQHAALTADSE